MSREKLPCFNNRFHFTPGLGPYDFYYITAKPSLYLKESELSVKLPTLQCYKSKYFRVEPAEATMIDGNIGPTKEDLFRHYAAMRHMIKLLEKKVDDLIETKKSEHTIVRNDQT